MHIHSNTEQAFASVEPSLLEGEMRKLIKKNYPKLSDIIFIANDLKYLKHKNYTRNHG